VLHPTTVLIIDTGFATSSFGEHTIIGTIGVVNAILRGVSPPFIAKVGHNRWPY